MRERVEKAERWLERFDRERERTQELKHRPRKRELARIDSDEAQAVRTLDELEARMGRLPIPSGAARQERAVAERVLAERRELAITAARVSPPAYIKNELGDRPSDSRKRQAWDWGVEEIETYRQRYGVKDSNRALGRERQREALRRLHEAQRTLGLGQHAARERNVGRSLGIGR